jgi:DNA-binding LytR/AlgR family response regulator
MNVLLIEDEDNAAIRLEKMVKKIKPEANFLDILESVESSIHWFSSNPSPDLVFMDIQLADGLSFSIFEKVKIECPVIFTTAFDEFAIKSFEVNSIDYLLKPINEEKLIKSLNKLDNLTAKWKQTNLQTEAKSLLQLLKGSGKAYRTRFMIQKADSYNVIPTYKVAWFIADQKEVMLIDSLNNHYFVNSSLDQLEKELDPSSFFRVNRQYIISINAIKKIHNYFNYKLKVELNPPSQTDVIVGRRKVSSFKDWLGETDHKS